MNRLSSSNGFFVDNKGRVVLLRGVNLSGATKVPVIPDGNTFIDQNDSFVGHKDVSFIGRPFLEEEANEHFDRLKKWGFNFLRFLVTWEAIEHKGYGIYDDEYIDYVCRMVSIAEKKGFYVFIDPHQDVWSRFTGGDGAPGWTLESLGMDVRKIAQSDTVLLQHVKKNNYKVMSWPLNYQKYPTATMFTAFFAGSVFANKIMIDGRNVQEYLQSAYIQSIVRLAKKLSKLKNVVGFDTLNEPSSGWIGHQDLNRYEGYGAGWIEAATPFEEMCMSEGLPVSVSNYLFLGAVKIPVGKSRLNPKGISIWQKDMDCIWKKQGVWNYDPNGAPMLLKPNYFSSVKGKNVDFFQDFLKPFTIQFKTAIQKVNKSFFIFMESDPSRLELDWDEKEKKGYAGVVNATHWYDVVLLFTKRYIDWIGFHSFTQKFYFGKTKVNQMYADCISAIRKMSLEKMNNCPTVIGETGIPMDMEKREGYKKKNYSKHEKAMNRIMNAIDKTLVNITLWNYTPDNSHDYGDKWNGEDLSLYSKDTPSEIDPDGGRAVRAFSRPYPMVTDGEPVSLSFDMDRGLFKYSFQKEGEIPGSCTIYIPPIHYGNGFRVEVSSGTYKYFKEKNILEFKGSDKSTRYGITIVPMDSAEKK